MTFQRVFTLFTFIVIGIFSVTQIHAQTCPQLLGSTVSSDDGFGQSIALSGDGLRLISGTPSANSPGTLAGNAEIYEFVDGDWEQMNGSFGFHDNGSRYGFDVDMNYDGTRVILGGPEDPTPPPNGTHRGGIRTYEYNGSNWAPMGDQLEGSIGYGRFGHSVAMNGVGDIIAVGQPGSGSQTGETSVFQWDGSEWVQIGQTIVGEEVDDLSGYHVDIDDAGTTLAIAEPQFETANGNDGRVRTYVFETDTWMLLGEIPSASQYVTTLVIEEESVQMDLSSDGQHLVLGSPHYSTAPGNPSDGKVETFTLVDGAWELDGEITGYSTLLGAAVAINEDGTIVSVTDDWRLRVFQKTGDEWVNMGSWLEPLDPSHLNETDMAMDASGYVFADSHGDYFGVSDADINIYEWPCAYFPGCHIPEGCNYNNLTTEDNETCDFDCLGCSDPLACNYDPAVEETLFGPTIIIDFDGYPAPFDVCCIDPNPEPLTSYYEGEYLPDVFADDVVQWPDGSCAMTSSPNVVKLWLGWGHVNFPYPVSNLSFTYISDYNFTVVVTTEEGEIFYQTEDTPWMFDIPNECPGSTFSVPGSGIISIDISDGGVFDPVYIDDITFTYGTACQMNSCDDPFACNYGSGCNGVACNYDSCAGCIDLGACNFDSTALVSDGSCEYLSCAGCIDSMACNFDSTAIIADDSCEYLTCAGCTESGACNYDPSATLESGSCEYLSCAGCMDSTACNFDPTATIDDGSCILPDGCVDTSACNFDATALCENGSCEYTSCAGCTDPTACNYDVDATLNDNSCEYESCAGCTDVQACNFTSEATLDDGSCVFLSDFDSTISIDGNTLSVAAEPALNYIWGECVNGVWSDLPAETQSSFTPSSDGSYGVEISHVDFENCVVSSDCVDIIITRIAIVEESPEWLVWPVPGDGNLSIQAPEGTTAYDLKIIDQAGKLLMTRNVFERGLTRLNLPLAAGMYQLQIHTEMGLNHAQSIVIIK